ncbi:MAG: TerB family tellurite resistance protein [Myxococcales bacterium]|nr:TerB family tellurite resistance protein [Myxococcales bacterium]
MLDSLDREERLRLMRFVCSFAWADLQVQDAERSLVAGLVKRLKLDPSEIALVEEWLNVPPPAEELDPTEIPREHRELFLEAVRQVVLADGHIDEEEAENFSLFEQLLGDR